MYKRQGYGIDMPSRNELIAAHRTDAEICREIGADGLVYQSLDDLKAAVREVNPAIVHFETSCFDGQYVTGDVTAEYLSHVELRRDDGAIAAHDDADGGQLDLNLVLAHET